MQLINQLTGLRFIAALGVVLCHFARPIQIPNSLLFLTDFFGSFVNLFFILSGFVLTLNYSHLNRPTNRDGYIKYAVSRLGRILPVYWLSLMAMAWLYIVFGFPPLKNDSVDWTMSFIANFFAIQSWVPSLFIQQSWNAPGWSISSEIFFYTSLPLLLKSKVIDGTDKGWIRIWSVLAILLTIYWLAIWLFLKGDTYDKNFLLAFPIRLPLFGIFCFAFGVNLGKSYLQDAPKYIERRGSIKLLITTIFILIVSWLCFELKKNNAYGQVFEIFCIYVVYTPYFCMLIRILSRSENFLTQIFSTKLMIFLGNSSYSLYLIHWLALMYLVLHTNQEDFVSNGIYSIFLCIFLSMVIYKYFENPLRNIIRLKFDEFGRTKP